MTDRSPESGPILTEITATFDADARSGRCDYPLAGFAGYSPDFSKMRRRAHTPFGMLDSRIVYLRISAL